jgi:hypothetical protein
MTLYEVYQQPIALDRFSMHDVGSNEAAGMKQNYLLNLDLKQTKARVMFLIPTVQYGK